MIDYKSLDGATVFLCAPTRAMCDVIELEARLGLAGASVLAPVPSIAGGELNPLQRARLASLQERKIAVSDAVVVGNVGGYLGAGSAAAIAQALRLGVAVHVLTDPDRLEVDDWSLDALVERRSTMLIRLAARELGGLPGGGLLEVFDPGGPRKGARRAWCRVLDVRRYATRDELVASVDPTRVHTGASEHGLAVLLEHRYPAPGPLAAIEVEFLGELSPERERDRARGRESGRCSSVAQLLLQDEGGRVLLVPDPNLPGAWLLPGGPVRAGELPRHAAARTAEEMLGAGVLVPDRLLVVDQLPRNADGVQRSVYVFGGEVERKAARRLEAVCGGRARFAPVRDFGDLVSLRELKRIIGALSRAAGVKAPVGLEDGLAPSPDSSWRWHPGTEAPQDLPVGEVGVWCFERDGRVLLQHWPYGHRFELPRACPHPADQDLTASAARGLFEESRVVIDPARAVLIGYHSTIMDPAFPRGMLRAVLAAPITGYNPHPSSTVQAPRGSGHRRFLVDVRRAGDFLDHGPDRYLQAEAAAQAAREFGIPVDRPAADGYRDRADLELVFAVMPQLLAEAGAR